MEFKACEECTEIKITEFNNGCQHLELFLKEGSKMKDCFKEIYKDDDPIPLGVNEQLKEIWGGNIVTFHL